MIIDAMSISNSKETFTEPMIFPMEEDEDIQRDRLGNQENRIFPCSDNEMSSFHSWNSRPDTPIPRLGTWDENHRLFIPTNWKLVHISGDDQKDTGETPLEMVSLVNALQRYNLNAKVKDDNILIIPRTTNTVSHSTNPVSYRSDTPGREASQLMDHRGMASL